MSDLAGDGDSRSILLVAHITPPTTMSAARRAGGLTKYLARLGHRSTVVTSVIGGSGPVPWASRTLRTRDLLVSPLNWRRSGLEALQGAGGQAAPGAPSALASWIVPDLQIATWVPFALTAARRLAARQQFDCVITTSPPASSHLLGPMLQAMGIPWVADFRDGWTFESQRPAWALGALGSLDRRLERAVASRADEICAVTAPIADDLARRFCRDVTTITNGFDPDDLLPAEAPGGRRADGARRTLVHTGTLSYGGRELGPLLAGLRRLRDTSATAADALEVVLVGPLTDAERGEIQRAGLADSFRLTGSVPHEDALALQRSADGLLVITGRRQSGVATGKLYEYLAASRPIVVLGDGTAAAAIVRDAHAGVGIALDDPETLSRTLRLLVEQPERLPRATPDAVARYAYPALARRMAELVERAIRRRAGDATATRAVARVARRHG